MSDLKWFSKWNRENPRDVLAPAYLAGVVGVAIIAATFLVVWGYPFRPASIQTGPRGTGMEVVKFPSTDPTIASFYTEAAIKPQGRGAARQGRLRERQGARRPDRGQLQPHDDGDDRLGLARPELRLLPWRRGRLRLRRPLHQGRRAPDDRDDAGDQLVLGRTRRPGRGSPASPATAGRTCRRTSGSTSRRSTRR